MITELSYFFINVIFGSELLFGIFFLILIMILHFAARTPIETLIVFSLLPVYALTKSGIFGGIVSLSAYPLTLIFCALFLYRGIQKLWSE